MQQEDKSAWLWVDQQSLEIKHLSFHLTDAYGPDIVALPFDYLSAMDVATGKTRLHMYEVIRLDQQLVVQHRTPQHCFNKFWPLISFAPSDPAHSPVQLSNISAQGFTAVLCNAVNDMVFYITMKNDPNYLIKKIDLGPYAGHATDTGRVFVPVGVQGPYSIYVKYNEVCYHAA